MRAQLFIYMIDHCPTAAKQKIIVKPWNDIYILSQVYMIDIIERASVVSNKKNILQLSHCCECRLENESLLERFCCVKGWRGLLNPLGRFNQDDRFLDVLDNDYCVEIKVWATHMYCRIYQTNILGLSSVFSGQPLFLWWFWLHILLYQKYFSLGLS